MQEYFANYEVWLFGLSHVADPRNAFLLLFPICFAINKGLGLQVLWTSAVNEWLNMVLKWIFRDDRPYWWTEAESCNLGYSNVNLRQYKMTCETGPGFPSGHVMSTSSVGLLLALHLKERLKSPLLMTPIWFVYIVLVSAGGLSRVYVATHFPHQILVGAIVGCSLSLCVRHAIAKYQQIMFGRLAAIAALLLLISGLAVYKILNVLGLDPSSTVKLALKFCQEPSWIHLDTTPFFCLIRDTSVLFGVALSSVMIYHCFGNTTLYFEKKIPPLVTLASIVVTCSLIVKIEGIPIDQDNVHWFYVMAGIKLTNLPIFVVITNLIFQLLYDSILDKKNR